MKTKKSKAGKIGVREVIVAIVIIIFLGSSFGMLLLGMMGGKTESKVTTEELKAANAAIADDSESDTNVSVMVFENDIVIDQTGAESQQPAEQPQPAAEQETDEQAPPAEETVSEYIFPDSDTNQLDEAKVSALSKEDLRIARNEILARHGRIFESEDLISYFESKSWYNGTVSPEEFDQNLDSRLNDAERYNIELIKKYE